MKRSLLFIFGFMLLSFGGNSSQAQIIFDTPSGNVSSGSGGFGFNENVYHNAPQGPFEPGDSDVSDVEAYAASTTPDYTFLNSNAGFNYSGGASTATVDYLGADAADAALSDANPTLDSIFDAFGYINISSAEVGQTFTFAINNADDAARIRIGGDGTAGSGTLICEQNFANSLDGSASQDVQFTAPGSYAIEIMTYEMVGGANLNISTYLNGDPATFDFNTSPTANPVPEPATWALLAGGLGCLLIRRRLN